MLHVQRYSKVLNFLKIYLLSPLFCEGKLNLPSVCYEVQRFKVTSILDNPMHFIKFSASMIAREMQFWSIRNG